MRGRRGRDPRRIRGSPPVAGHGENMSRFTHALDDFVYAKNAYDSAVSGAGREEGARLLAQAGDVLEREMRQMMQEEVRRSGAAPLTMEDR